MSSPFSRYSLLYHYLNMASPQVTKATHWPAPRLWRARRDNCKRGASSVTWRQPHVHTHTHTRTWTGFKTTTHRTLLHWCTHTHTQLKLGSNSPAKLMNGKPVRDHILMANPNSFCTVELSSLSRVSTTHSHFDPFKYQRLVSGSQLQTLTLLTSVLDVAGILSFRDKLLSSQKL